MEIANRVRGDGTAVGGEVAEVVFAFVEGEGGAEPVEVERLGDVPDPVDERGWENGAGVNVVAVDLRDWEKAGVESGFRAADGIDSDLGGKDGVEGA